MLIHIAWPVPWSSNIPGALPFIIKATRTESQVLTEEDQEA